MQKTEQHTSDTVTFPDIPITVDLVEPQTLTISKVPLLLLFSVTLGLMNASGSSTSLYMGIGAVTLIALTGIPVYLPKIRKQH